MNKKTLLSLIITISLIIISCESYKEEPSRVVKCNMLRSFEGITTLNEEAYSGSCIVYINDIKTDLKSFKNGVPHGIYKKYYYPSEKILYIGYRKKGEIHGNFVNYHENGKKAIEGSLKRGYYTGTWKYYNDQGILTEEKVYRRGKEIK